MAVYRLKHGQSSGIANFGFENTEVDSLIKQERKERVNKKKDYMAAITQAKRLLPQYAKEERLQQE